MHKGCNLEGAFDVALQADSAAVGRIGTTTQDEEEEADTDEITILHAITSIRGESVDDFGGKIFQCVWAGVERGDPQHDEWVDEEDLLGSQQLTDWDAAHEGNGVEARKGKPRTKMPPGKQLVYEVNKYFCANGRREDMAGNKYSLWLAHQGDTRNQVHLKMKPIVGSRYMVYGYNSKIVYICRQDYIDYLAEVKAKKGYLNRLEKSIVTGLQDPLALSHIQAQAILTHEITTPILWMGKKSKILDCNVFLADVLASLKRWGDQASTHATELMALDGHLRKYTYPDDSAHDDECMVHVVASRDDVNEDAHVLALLKGCCEAGVILWRRHCSEHLEPDDSAKVPTDAEIKVQA